MPADSDESDEGEDEKKEDGIILFPKSKSNVSLEVEKDEETKAREKMEHIEKNLKI